MREHPIGKKPRAASKRWLVGAPECVIDVFDSGDTVVDRYSVWIRFDRDYTEPGYVNYLGLSEKPEHPQGFSLWGHLSWSRFSRYRRTARRQRIRWGDLPENVRDHVRKRLAS